jgi:predicted AAA+ superfamily ATPase
MLTDIFNLQNPWRFQKDYQFSYQARSILKELIAQLDNEKIIGLVGSRQVGKSSLLFLLIQHLLLNNTPKEHIFYFNLDDLKLRELVDSIPDFVHFIAPKADQKKYIFLDEVQRLPNPGLFLKELYDLKLNIKIFYSGSSQMEIRSKIKEYGVGRIRECVIERLSFEEYLAFTHPTTRKDALAEYLIYGSYPEVAKTRAATEKKLLIKDIYQTYLTKDIVDFLKITNTDGFNKLLGLLAHQISGLLSLDTLSKNAGITRHEAEMFLIALEQTFIIKRVYPFFKSYKKEITKTPKVYFLDLGLRNFIINNFSKDETRSDMGALFENFYLLQLLSGDPYRLQKLNFWRTTNQTEIDFIVTNGEALCAIETKYGTGSPPKSFKTIRAHYPAIGTQLVTKETVLAGAA